MYVARFCAIHMLSHVQGCSLMQARFILILIHLLQQVCWWVAGQRIVWFTEIMHKYIEILLIYLLLSDFSLSTGKIWANKHYCASSEEHTLPLQEQPQAIESQKKKKGERESIAARESTMGNIRLLYIAPTS